MRHVRITKMVFAARLAITCAAVACCTTFALAGEHERYVIAHMANTPAAVDWAVTHGANGVEVDLRFSDSGEAIEFRHGGICDCVCAPGRSSICAALAGSHPRACEASEAPATLLSHLGKKAEIAIVVIDSKVEGLSPPALAAAGRKTVRLIEKHLFGAGYSGNVVVGVAKLASVGFLRAAARAIRPSSFANKVFFSIDQERNKATDVLTALRDLPSRARTFGTGISACLIGDFRKGIGAADRNRKSGSASFVYVWTLDRPWSMARYLDAGTQGIITNYPARLRSVMAARGEKLATRRTVIPLATSEQISKPCN